MNTDMLGFSDEYKSLVAIPNRFDCCVGLAMKDGSGVSLEVED
jgi:hypothetical protein